VNESARGLDLANSLSCRILAERVDVAVGLKHAVVIDPADAPAETGNAETLESLGERPQLVESERVAGARHELLTHRGR
jgi:hypothetical protein